MSILAHRLKGRLQKFANRFGYKVEKLRSNFEPIDVFTLVIELECRANPDFYFVQIGANDGQTDDPLHPLIVRHKLRGLLIEPQPAAFQRLIQNYAHQPQLVFENVAIAEQPGTAQMYTAEGNDCLASFDEAHVRKNVPLGTKVLTLEVPAMPLDQLIKKYKIEQIGLLQIDAEGFDYQILKMVNFQVRKPKIIHFEHLNMLPNDYVASIRLLSEQGYRMYAHDINTLAYLQSDSGPK
jgi:FkbM family methyltransferase